MVIERSSSRRMADLVRELAGSDPVAREAAVARLAIAGARAIDPLLRALETTAPADRATILIALGGLAEPRTLEPVIDHLRSPHPHVAEAAVGAVRVHLLSRNADLASRAIGALTAVCVDRAREDTVRLAALDALADVGEAIIAPLKEQLRSDPSARIRRAATSEGEAGTAGAEAAVARLEAAVVHPGDDPHAVLQWIREGAGDASLSTLHELILALRERERAALPPARSAWAAPIGAAHLALAERGSRLAVFDLREALGQVPADRQGDYVAATAAVGDASCLEPLANAWRRSRSDAARRPIEAAAGGIVRREHLTRRHAAWKKLAARFPDAAAAFWPAAAADRGGPTPPKPRSSDGRER